MHLLKALISIVKAADNFQLLLFLAASRNQACVKSLFFWLHRLHINALP